MELFAVFGDQMKFPLITTSEKEPPYTAVGRAYKLSPSSVVVIDLPAPELLSPKATSNDLKVVCRVCGNDETK